MLMSRHRQQGAVLIVSLILLLIITAIAAATLSSSTFQTTVTTNAQLRETTFRVAESAAEQVLPLSNPVANAARTAQLTNSTYSVSVSTAQQGIATPTATVRYPGNTDGQRPAMLPGVQVGGDVTYMVRDYEVTGSVGTSDGRIGTQAVLGVAKIEPQLGGS